MDRHYGRCSYCERPLAFEADRTDIQFILDQPCPLCGEKALRYMGRVQRKNLVKDITKSVCDERCTNARGPHCDCFCGNVNHGTKKLIVFNKVVGRLEVVEKDLLNHNTEYLARIKRMAAAKNSIKVKVITFLNYMNRKILVEAKEKGGYWRLQYDDYHQYRMYQDMLRKIDKIEDLKSIQRKINSLTHLIPSIGGTLEYLESLSWKKEQEVSKCV
jgi:hypothetical protein